MPRPDSGATLRELGLADAVGQLMSPSGVVLRTGPVTVRARTPIRRVAHAVATLYADYPLLGDDSFVDFDVAVRRPAGPQGWLGRQVCFEVDGGRPFNPLAGDQGLPLLEWGLNWCVYSHCHQFVVLHAAVLEREGRALLLPAPSGSGKSTLCAALALSGWRLLSDELALIDPADGLLVPLPRPVSVKNASIEVLSRRFPQLEFGSRVDETVKGTVAHFAAPADAVAAASVRARASWVALPRWVQGAPAVLSPLGRAEGFMALVENAFNYDLHGARGFQALADMVEGCRCFRFEYGAIDDALARFEALAREGG